MIQVQMHQVEQIISPHLAWHLSVMLWRNMISSWQNTALTYVGGPLFHQGAPAVWSPPKVQGLRPLSSWPFQDKWQITDHSRCCSAQHLHLRIQMHLCLPHFRINQGSFTVLCTPKSVLVLLCVYEWFGVSRCFALMFPFLSWALSWEFFATWLKWQLTARLKGSNEELCKKSQMESVCSDVWSKM